jgi:hypothetical protein
MNHHHLRQSLPLHRYGVGSAKTFDRLVEEIENIFFRV